MPIRQQQLPAPVTPALTAAFQRTLTADRWRTYQFAGGFDDNLAHRLYLWNAAVGQSFHFPLQSVEVALRNVVHQALTAQYGGLWPQDNACQAVLGARALADIAKAVNRHIRKYGAAPNTAQLVASLSLGFWVATLRRPFNTPVWKAQAAVAFPGLGQSTMSDVSRTGTEIQDLRNRIFHQEPLIGHNLSVEYAAILRMLGWICPETRDWTRAHSSVPRVLRERPR